MLAVVEASGVQVSNWKRVKAKWQLAKKAEKTEKEKAEAAKNENKVGMQQAEFAGAAC